MKKFIATLVLAIIVNILYSNNIAYAEGGVQIQCKPTLWNFVGCFVTSMYDQPLTVYDYSANRGNLNIKKMNDGKPFTLKFGESHDLFVINPLYDNLVEVELNTNMGEIRIPISHK